MPVNPQYWLSGGIQSPKSAALPVPEAWTVTASPQNHTIRLSVWTKRRGLATLSVSPITFKSTLSPVMKIATMRPGVNAFGHLVLAVDVSKQFLDCYIRLTDTYRRVANTTPAISSHVGTVRQLAAEHHLSGVVVACEPSGGYEQTLVAAARATRCTVVHVSGEQVAQLRKIESLDTGKTDVKDPRVIELAVRLGKSRPCRHLPPTYEELRLLTAAAGADERTRARTKQRIITTTLGLFPGYDIGPNRFFSRTGRAVIEAYSLSPAAIMRAGRIRFGRTIRRRVPGVHEATLDRIFDQAHAAPCRLDGATELLTRRVRELTVDLERLEARIEQTRTAIGTRGRVLQDMGLLCTLDQSVSGLTLYNLARIAGEAGPFGDFHTKRALLRYGGLNLRERQSGTYRGKTRISKKGRVMLRKAVAQATFPLLRRDRLLGPYYTKKRTEGMCAQKAKVAVMRKFLVMVYSLSLSRETFNMARFRGPAHSSARHLQQMVC